MIKVNDNEVMKWAAGAQPINRAYDHDNLIFPEFSGTVPPSLPAGFVFNFNARDYNPATRTIPAENGALELNAFILGADPVAVNADSLTIDSYNNNSMVAQISSGKTQYYSIDGTNNRAATWIFKFGAYGSEHAPHFLSNRTTRTYNWMVRTYTDEMHVCLHDSANHCDLSLDGTYPVIVAITVEPVNGAVTMRNITEGTTVQPFNFDYYYRSNATPAFFEGYSNYTSTQEFYQGMFYWAFFANRCLTDAEITQVIDYNEN